MEIAVRLIEIGSIIGIDEGIIGFKGRSRPKLLEDIFYSGISISPA
ncbi:hypothetical protein S7711_11628 [Stachybotrys chartarum IBT 7711]|uniref:PiggyBac transposable element-derived protein domain-containing protein n=1 Tax=Stachybotrys chartarum (strain CBS 109288 / IBT 7711) TaxID=1280523 RepID=A0A084B6S6_STACB|nr:hypothetical protein S7711_11628 [Stachybotrys chartarum IBT 7711]